MFVAEKERLMYCYYLFYINLNIIIYVKTFALKALAISSIFLITYKPETNKRPINVRVVSSKLN